jgi:hypothetical protein
MRFLLPAYRAEGKAYFTLGDRLHRRASQVGGNGRGACENACTRGMAGVYSSQGPGGVCRHRANARAEVGAQ